MALDRCFVIWCVGAYFAPLIIIFTAYIRIISVVVIRGNVLSTLYAGRSMSFTVGKRQEMQQTKSAKTSFFVVAGWAIAWTPYAIVSLLAILGATEYITPVICQIPAIFAKTAAVYNPIMHGIVKLSSRYSTTYRSMEPAVRIYTVGIPPRALLPRKAGQPLFMGGRLPNLVYDVGIYR
ncbi:hypothetical protein RvY_14828 [Ramazzottius varieornatus]|uniref:G-protein coupled receptors family 1 profile domain-containing protein n=1 Tax=Ramazzottius varieornatus TaxID=947166 RepID=A0A1D1VU72_RAMVA|nr:hypothetical protein RvY_14828 [Ramazzottius varieornatus]